MTTGAAATSRCVRKYTAAATRNSIMQTKNTRRPSRSRSRRAPRTYAQSLVRADGATLDDLHEAVTMFEETARTARRVLGSAHPTTTGIENGLQKARTVLHASETRDMLAAAARTFARG